MYLDTIHGRRKRFLHPNAPVPPKKLINHNTIMLLGGAPEYPHGIIDPITELGQLGVKYDIPVHVDACVGGYLLPFMEQAGANLPLFDFRVPGVTSMSADIHKYGFASKGCSCILYKNVEIFRCQCFAHHSWPGGVFASPAFLGTRPGGAYAAAWAAIQANDRLQHPDALHAMITCAHSDVIDEYLSDLKWAVGEVKGHSELAFRKDAATYSLVGHLPLDGIVRKTVLDVFVDGYVVGKGDIDLSEGSSVTGNEKLDGIINKLILKDMAKPGLLRKAVNGAKNAAIGTAVTAAGAAVGAAAVKAYKVYKIFKK